jgi:hypothetical protein
MTQRLFSGQTPTSGENTDGTPGITLGTAVQFDEDGDVTGVEFFATVTVSGTYTVALWEVTAADPNGSGGTLLASKTMAAPPVSAAWNSVLFDTAVTIDTAKLYKVSIFSGAGLYVLTPSFGFPLTNGSITAPANGSNPVGLGNLNQGSFTINASQAYPTGGGGSCYFPGPIFEPAAAANDLASAITLPALQSATVLGAQSALASAVSLPALQAAAELTAQSALASALSLPAMSMSNVLSMSNPLASALSLPALDMVTTLIDDTSSPNAPISTSSRPFVISTASRAIVISTGTQGGM